MASGWQARATPPDSGQCNPQNAGQWVLLPSHEQAQHRTLALSRANSLRSSLAAAVGVGSSAWFGAGSAEGLCPSNAPPRACPTT